MILFFRALNKQKANHQSGDESALKKRKSSKFQIIVHVPVTRLLPDRIKLKLALR